MMGSGPQSSWLRVIRGNPDARLRLICFPYAGAGAWVFRSWPDDLPEDIEVIAIELPGRGTRLREDLVRDIPTLVRESALALEPLLRMPFAFFGHSLGGLLAFGVARWLRRMALPLPEHIFVSASAAPHLSASKRPMHTLSDDDFIARLRQYGGTPPEIIDDRPLMESILPYLRADFEAFETYQHEAERPLDRAISAYGGTRDRGVRMHHLEGWAEHTSREFVLEMLPGDHFFLNHPYSGLLPALSRQLEAIATSAGSGRRDRGGEMPRVRAAAG